MDPQGPIIPDSAPTRPASEAEASAAPLLGQGTEEISPLRQEGELSDPLAILIEQAQAGDQRSADRLAEINRLLTEAGGRQAAAPAGVPSQAGNGSRDGDRLADEAGQVSRALSFSEEGSPTRTLSDARVTSAAKAAEEQKRNVIVPRLIAAEEEARRSKANAEKYRKVLEERGLLGAVERGIRAPIPSGRSSSLPRGVQDRVKAFEISAAAKVGKGTSTEPNYRTAYKESRQRRSGRSPSRGGGDPVDINVVLAESQRMVAIAREEAASDRAILAVEREELQTLSQEIKAERELWQAGRTAPGTQGDSATAAGPPAGPTSLGSGGVRPEIQEVVDLAVASAVSVAQQLGVSNQNSKSGDFGGEAKIPSHLRAPTFDPSKLPKLDWSNIPKDFLLRLDWINELEAELKTTLSLFFPHGEGEAYSKRVVQRAKSSWLRQCKHKDYVTLPLTTPHGSGTGLETSSSSGSGSGTTFASAEALYDIQHVAFVFPHSGLEEISSESWKTRESFLESQIAPAFVKNIPNNLREAMKVLLGSKTIPSVPDQLAYLFFNMYRHHKQQYRALQESCQKWSPVTSDSIEVLIPKLKRYEEIMEFWDVEKRKLEVITELVYPILNKRMDQLPGDVSFRWKNYRTTYLRPDLHEGRDWDPMWDYLDKALGYLEKNPLPAVLRVKSALKGEVVQGADGNPQGNLGNSGGKKKKRGKGGKGAKKGKDKKRGRKGHQADNQGNNNNNAPEANLAAPIMTAPGNFKGTISEAWKAYETHGGCTHCWKGKHKIADCFVKKDGKPPMKRAEGYPRYDFWYNGGKTKAERNKDKKVGKKKKKAEAKLAAQAAQAASQPAGQANQSGQAAQPQAQFSAPGQGQQKGNPGGKGAVKGAGGGCFNCGDTGHFKRECPHPIKGGGKGKPGGGKGAHGGKGAPQAHWVQTTTPEWGAYLGQSPTPTVSNQTYIPAGGYYTTVPPSIAHLGKGGVIHTHPAVQQHPTQVPASSTAIQGYTAAAPAPVAPADGQTQHVYWLGPHHEAHSAISLPSNSREATVENQEIQRALETQRLFREAGAFGQRG